MHCRHDEAHLRCGRKGHIFGVYVLAAQRGKGVGREKLYRDLGFEVYGTEPNALKIGSLYVDEDHTILRTR